MMGKGDSILGYSCTVHSEVGERVCLWCCNCPLLLALYLSMIHELCKDILTSHYMIRTGNAHCCEVNKGMKLYSLK